jgi:heptosyltransferase-1
MGDLIHALPALTDAQHAIPGIRFDWVVDEAFADIPRMHPAVDQIITTAHRRWQREKIKSLKSGELFSLAKTIRSKDYDAVIDAQNNVKSAVVTLLTRGTRYGMDKHSTREKFSDWVCDKTFNIPVDQHAIARQRQLFAKALNYPLPESAPDFGIALDKLPAVSLSLPKPYLAFVHSTTWDTKHWPENYWKLLIKRAVAAGYQIILPWGNAQEAERAARLADAAPDQCTVLPKLSIMQQASVLLGAAGAVCVDTGLGHLTAALNVPAVHLYGPTDPALIGATGLHQKHLIAEYECAPCYLHHCKFGAESACFLKNMKPEKVFCALDIRSF